MKKIYLYSILAICILGLLPFNGFAQSRKYISQFSHFQNYYNPGLTGYEGSTARGFVRNQWAGFEGAPKTVFVSAEFDFAEMGKSSDPALLGKNAAGLSVLHDQYGPFQETEIIASYASRIRISSSTNLRLGAGVNYNTVRLDGSRLSTEQLNDPTTGQYYNNFANMNVLDFNIGLAITHANYYLSYGAHNVNKGALSSGDVFMERKPTVSILQAGYRQALSADLAVIANFMYRSQEDLPDNTEFNVKALLMDKLWIGAGHRVNYANNFQLGFLLNKMSIGYVYETPMNRSYLLPNTTHEFLASFRLFRTNQRTHSKEVLIW
ncbi:type IX secretion system membrane protein PorP/SprF [Litoribacter alkaliphilus]|uniref:Type IX secretion system membrane protein PorP/SprF n=1 Tax=Litoribacter ruber TaxID=702568 RepID=A0AAP2CJ07_9BACT|nr:type IX secretion system membrane protein PorP/SprF [Litoribacter alkaliphilus]MBS9525631.1 type IX secretion system membrane protein PorP/SprF [Litoribacter alkaliphilus]